MVCRQGKLYIGGIITIMSIYIHGRGNSFEFMTKKLIGILSHYGEIEKSHIQHHTYFSTYSRSRIMSSKNNTHRLLPAFMHVHGLRRT